MDKVQRAAAKSAAQTDMNSNQPFENEKSDKAFRQILGAWRVDAALPPHFQERVWERIGGRERFAPSIWLMVLQRFATLLTRPAFATVYMAMLLLIGVSAGCERGQSKTAQIKSDLQTRYIQMVDPYKTPQ